MKEKILCVGFHKTGTTSLGNALEILGFNRLGWSGSNALKFHSGKIGELLRVSDQFDCFEDFPWPLLFKDFHQRHPQTKFILTKRSSMEIWFESLAQHCDRYPPSKTDFRRMLYDLDHPREDPAHVKRVHQQHIDSVRSYAARNDVPLLEMCMQPGVGWSELCDFLGVENPDAAFPLANVAPGGHGKRNTSARRRITGRLKATVRSLLNRS